MLLVVLSTVAALATGVSSPDFNASPNPSVHPQKNVLTCRNEAISGSRIGVFHVCMSQRDWDARADNARGFLSQFQNRSAIQLTR